VAGAEEVDRVDADGEESDNESVSSDEDSILSYESGASDDSS